ncbi:protein of unknown function [Xenorhabdus poinarii G6]|uniref:Uncharacterized protein n=1 Tax=Xenorhabdus poinarii G6 TaxID=1354304 RepID=A0A068R592_9GAMM|nr:protein of unknown function [Xenorhabdus poinarii G6]
MVDYYQGWRMVSSLQLLLVSQQDWFLRTNLGQLYHSYLVVPQ